MVSRWRAGVVMVCLLGLVAVLAACGGNIGIGAGPSSSKDVEVFTWWADGGEKAGLDGLVSAFSATCADYRFVNGSIIGGAGANAKQTLAARLQQGKPPETFQAHAGAELSDYIKAGQIQDLSAYYQQWGLANAFPKGLIDNLTVDGKIYSVPANIHRANVLWSNKKVLASAGITRNPTGIDELVTDLEKVRAAGIAAPLAIGRDWTQLMLFEAVLITDLGPDRFRDLWHSNANWGGDAVAMAIGDYQRLLAYSTADRETLDWSDAEKLLVHDGAAFQLMGDWEAGDLESKGFKDYDFFAFPGNGNAYQWLADSFVLPKGARNAEGARCWLKTIGSAEGQKAFNTKKGSIPARVDAAPWDYPAYQKAAMSDWKSGVQVPSCAHGSACSVDLQTAANVALAKFGADGDALALQNAMASAVNQFGR